LTGLLFRITIGNANMQQTRRYTKQARAVMEERTRAALLDAAERLFFERGWDATSLDAVAGEAGVTKQTLLRHFGSKAGLLEHAFERAFENVRDQRWDVPGDDVERAVDNLLDHYRAVGDQALKIDAMAGVEGVAHWVQRARQLHYEWVDHAFGAFLRGPDRERRRAGLIAVCDVHSWQLLHRHLGLETAEVRATLILAIRGLLEVDR
jgi:AcrR family transcriptional regulator